MRIHTQALASLILAVAIPGHSFVPKYSPSVPISWCKSCVTTTAMEARRTTAIQMVTTIKSASVQTKDSNLNIGNDMDDAKIHRAIRKQRRKERLQTSDKCAEGESYDDDVVGDTSVTSRSKKRQRVKTSSVAASNLPYSCAIKAISVYHSIHGDLVIPRRYLVPHDSKEYPSEWHGVDLARTVYDMKWWTRHVRSHPERVAELNELGFVWERLQPEWNLILEALIVYSNLQKRTRGRSNGEMDELLVPTSFVVPHGNTQWPRATWGIPLGRCAHRIRSRHDFLRGKSDRIAQLNGLGFVWDVNDHMFRKAFRALQFYAKNERKGKVLLVPSTFVVPSGEEHGWPQDLWGFPLGAKCSAIRYKGLYVKNNPERRRALEALGFQWTANSTLGWYQVVHAAAIYSQVHGKKLDVPFNFVVPEPPKISCDDGQSQRMDNAQLTASDDAWPWPEQLWGLALGQRLKDVRLKGAYLSGSSAANRRRQLDALGFVWKPKRGRRKTVHVEES